MIIIKGVTFFLALAGVIAVFHNMYRVAKVYALNAYTLSPLCTNRFNT